ncbi:START domain containing protein [Trema orientale]|uniref:START domain containing protein n=1 Tax=Trema orientale TaxID=63057 RepID=A0A2P5FRH0_TREOI|nr:START domain containing protein [Trema orientale]
MARSSGNSRSTDFVSLVEDEFQQCYMSDTLELHFKGLRSTINKHNFVEQIGQNYNLEGIGMQYIDDSPQLPDHAIHSSYYDPFKPQDLEETNSNESTNIQHHRHRATDLFLAVSICSEENKKKISDLAWEAMEELRKMVLVGEPLWKLDQDKNIETLDKIEYIKGHGNMNDILRVIMNLIEVGHYEPLPPYGKYYNDHNESTEEEYNYMSNEVRSGYFHNQKADDQDDLHYEASREIGFIEKNPVELLEILMDLMVAEYQVPSPLVPCRESYFTRYCKRLGDMMWGVVDVSLESLFKFPSSSLFRRLPSGCLIQQMPNGSYKVIWIEHVEANNRVVHHIFQPMVTPGFTFSSKCWLATLARACERSAALVARVNSSTIDRGAEDMGFTITNNYINNPRMPPDFAVVFATTLKFPVPPSQLFDFLRDEKNRPKVTPDKIAVLYLQESCTDSTESYVVFAPMDILAVSKVLSGGNPDHVTILPSGFAILPDETTMIKGIASGSLLTVAFHIIDASSTQDYIHVQSLHAMHHIVKDTIMSIKGALISNT